MTLVQEFVPLKLEQLHREAAVLKIEGWRFIQTHAVNTDDGVDLYYSFMKDGKVVNYRIEGVQKDQPVPSITDLFLAAFVFENEARELFGIDMRDIAIDFNGAMYAPAQHEPMTFMTPEQKAARENAKKAAVAKLETSDKQDDSMGGKAKPGFVMTPERKVRLDAKLATMSPEKVAKVEAALKARAAEASASADVSKAAEPKADTVQAAAGDAPACEPSPAAEKDTVLEAKLAAMEPEKAAKVLAALGGGQSEGASAAAEAQASGAVATEGYEGDAQLESLIGLMDESKANVVRAALSVKEGN